MFLTYDNVVYEHYESMEIKLGNMSEHIHIHVQVWKEAK